MKNTIITLLIILFASCSKDNNEENYNPQLPALTQIGANTFGAIINGKIMVPRNSQGYKPPGSSHNPVLYTGFDNWEQISAGDRKTEMGGIYMYIENLDKVYPLKVDSYIIGDSDGAFSNSFAKNTLITASAYDSNGNRKTYLSIANTGSINILRSDNDIISGTFSCKLKYENNPNDIIEIKEGRFDFNKSTINSTDFK
jgi:hypothetical protein